MNINTQVCCDYNFALFTFLWAEMANEKYIVFGSFDFVPKEMNECDEVDKCSMSLDEESNIVLNFCRVKLSCEDALAMYTTCRETGKVSFFSIDIFMENNRSASPVEIPTWPHLDLGKRGKDSLCPFLPETWGDCRIHHIMPNEICAQVLELAQYEKPITWMKERLLWDISMYPELIGSIHLVLPNPLIRNVFERLIPQKEYKVAINLELRQGKNIQDLKKVKFLAMERNFFGISNVQEIEILKLNKTSFQIDLNSNNIQEFATAIYDEDRGLLYWSSFGNFIMGFNIDIRVLNAKRKILLPNIKDSYVVDTFAHEVQTMTSMRKDSWGERLYFQQVKRIQDKYAKKFGQHLFKEGTPNESEAFIRELVQQTKKAITIVDPYFGTLELFKYLLAIPSPVNITIITGADMMNINAENSNSNGKSIITGMKLLKKINELKEKLNGYKIQVKVMTGDGIFHDRFLIIDDQVWFSGNSFNSIGKRASMMIRLPNPQEFVDYLSELESNNNEKEKRIIELETWLKRK